MVLWKLLVLAQLQPTTCQSSDIVRVVCGVVYLAYLVLAVARIPCKALGHDFVAGLDQIVW